MSTPFQVAAIISDTLFNIRGMDQYWMHLSKEYGGEGMSYFEIAQVLAKKMNYVGDDARDKARDLENTVQKSVNAYKALVEPKA